MNLIRIPAAVQTTVTLDAFTLVGVALLILILTVLSMLLWIELKNDKLRKELLTPEQIKALRLHEPSPEGDDHAPVGIASPSISSMPFPQGH